MKMLFQKFEARYKSFVKGENPVFGIYLMLLVGAMAIFILPWALTRQSFFPSLEGHGAVGDAINGVAGPFIALGAAILTFMAFNAQLNANTAQKQQFLDQAKDVKRERFESRFFEMIRLHRANVEEQNVQDRIFGRKVFTTYYFELRYIYFALEQCHRNNMPKPALSVGELTNLAYLIFFYGIGHVTKKVFDQLAPAYANLDFFRKLIEKLELQQNAYKIGEGAINTDLVIESDLGKAIFVQVYRPFTGHGAKLGHYYRHLVRSTRYVHEQDESFLSPKDKNDYVRMLQCQLSNFEQIMLHYNSVSLLGLGWETYIVKYQMIVNVPYAFTDFGLTPELKYKDIIEVDRNFSHWLFMTRKLKERENRVGE